MPRTKTTILIDERLLDQFRALVVSKHGSSRMLSLEFEEAVRAFLPTEVLRTLAGKLGIELGRYPSLEEVARSRPKLHLSAGRIVRRTRDERRRLPRHK